jgi:hypothetical protein
MKYFKTTIFLSLLLTAFVNDSAIAQGERKLKQELFFYKGDNYRAITFDTLGRQIFKWNKVKKSADSYEHSITLTERSKNKNVHTTVYGKVNKKQKLKKNLYKAFDGQIEIVSMDSVNRNLVTRMEYNFKFKKPNLSHDIKTILQEEIELFSKDSLVTRFAFPQDSRFISENKHAQVLWFMPPPDYYKLFKNTPSLYLEDYDSSGFIGKYNYTTTCDNQLSTIDLLSTLCFNYNYNGIYEVGRRYVTAFDSERRVSKFELYDMLKDSEQISTYYKVIAISYEYLEPYREKQNWQHYDVSGKLIKSYTIEIKESFY